MRTVRAPLWGGSVHRVKGNVASVRQLMQAMVIPSSDALFHVARQPPKDEKEWTALQNSAVILAESGNLLIIGSRARNTEVWMKTSQVLVKAGMVALKDVRNVPRKALG